MWRQKEGGQSQVFPKPPYHPATHVFIPSLPNPHPPYPRSLAWALLDIRLNCFSPLTNDNGKGGPTEFRSVPTWAWPCPWKHGRTFLLLWGVSCFLSIPASLVRLWLWDGLFFFFVCQPKAVLERFLKWHSNHSHSPMTLIVRTGLGEIGVSLPWE